MYNCLVLWPDSFVFTAICCPKTCATVQAAKLVLRAGNLLLRAGTLPLKAATLVLQAGNLPL